MGLTTLVNSAGTIDVSTEGLFPPDIRTALSADRGYVIVVSGEPGTGKSLFAQEILREFPSSCAILTDKEGWGEIKTGPSPAITAWKERHFVVDYWRPVAWSSSHDAPFRQKINELVADEPGLRDFGIVVVDSWTGLVEPIDSTRRTEILQSLVQTAREERKKLVLVADTAKLGGDLSRLNHVADAIIILEKGRTDGRMYRQLVIEKLRSMPIAQDTFVFTLDRGLFTYVPWYVHQYPPIMIEREPLRDPSPDRISTGNRSFDTLTKGGFVKGTLSLIEVDNLGAPYLETIYLPFLSNHLQLGRPAIVLLPEGWSPERLTNGLSQFVDREIVEKQVVFFGRQALGRKGNVRAIDDDPWKTLQEIRYEAGQLERQFGMEVTELFALDTLENKYGAAHVQELMAEVTAALPDTKRVTLTILGRQQAIKSTSLCHTIQLRVQEIGGVLTVCGVNPRTNFFAIRPILSGGFLDFDLLPIV
jgi:KaiC/GvpD/RAD55 family RecA-like ATPase